MGSMMEFVSLAKAREICPVCGHNDWCSIARPHDNPQASLYYCRRYAGYGFSQELFTRYSSSYTGQEYVVVSLNNERVVLQEINEWMAIHPGYKLKDGTRAPGGANAMAFKPKKQKVFDAPEVEKLPPQSLNEVYRAFLDELVLEDRHREYLHGEGLTDKLIEAYNIKSIPEYDNFLQSNRQNGRIVKSANKTRKQISFELYKKLGNNIAGTPGFYVKDNAWTFSGPSGLVIPVPDIHGNYVGMRIRVDKRWRNANGYTITEEQFNKEKREAEASGRPYQGTQCGKYLWMSSYKDASRFDANGVEHVYNAMRYGVRAGCPAGFYFPVSTARKNAKATICLTEGEKKSIVASERLGFTFIDVPGVSAWGQLFEKDSSGESPMEILKKSGVKMAIVAFDADKEKNRAVLQQQNNLVNALKAAHIATAIVGWDINIGKGIDDLLVHGTEKDLHFELVM